MRRFLAGLGLAALLLAGWAGHPLHLSYGRVTIERGAVTLRIRTFKDDLETALTRHHRLRDSLVITAPGPRVDSLFAGYLAGAFLLTADDRPVAGRVTASGPEQDMWWFEVRYPLARRPTRLGLASRIFFELFEDQQNLLKVVDAPTGEEHSLYFVRGEPGPVAIRLPARE